MGDTARVSIAGGVTTPNRDRAVRTWLLPERHAPLAARQFLLGLSGIPAARLSEIQVMVSELVTNSVIHAGLRGDQSIGLSVSWPGSRLRVEVSDAGPGFVTPPAPAPADALGGRGLFLVEQMSDGWGAATTDRTRVWFEIEAR
jgi:anti-sigma regulatory factor (Ser/Thr protein kinase)